MGLYRGIFCRGYVGDNGKQNGNYYLGFRVAGLVLVTAEGALNEYLRKSYLIETRKPFPMLQPPSLNSKLSQE